MHRIIVFGTGLYWKNKKDEVIKYSDVVCFIDNNQDKIGTYIDNKLIDSPYNIGMYEYDYILIMSQYEEQMKKQLLELGISENVIWNWKDYICNGLREVYTYYIDGEIGDIDTLIITHPMDYYGATIAVVYAAQALIDQGKNIIICAQSSNKEYLDEIRKKGLNILIAPILEFDINAEIMKLVKMSKNIIVNVLQMIPIVYRLNRQKPVLWWIHESMMLYEPILKKFQDYVEVCNFDKINIKAVGRIAKDNFNMFFPNRIDSIMPYGIPDYANEDRITGIGNKHRRIVFAVIGTLSEIKGQDIFVGAVKLLKKEEREKAVFLIIGSDNNQFGKDIQRMSDGIQEIKFTGNLNRQQMNEIYPRIDVVVCPSRADVLPIVVTEGMMYRKACIISDKTGTKDYIKNLESGFICHAGDETDLCNKMIYCINNPKEIQRIGNEGRKVYEKIFTMDKLSDRICKELNETMEAFNNEIKNVSK